MKYGMFAVRGSRVKWRKRRTSGCGSSRGFLLVLCLLSGAAYPVVQAEEWVHPMTETPVERRIAGAFGPVDELSHLERLPRQLARVTVNGRELVELPWFVQDCNPVHRWLEDDYPIDGRHLRLGSENVVSVEALSCDGVVAFNDFGYRAFAVVPKRRNGGDKAKDTEGRKTTCN